MKVIGKLNNIKNIKHRGVVGFEYVIILTIMSTALYGTYNTLSGSLHNKGNDISEFIDHNGQIPIKGGSGSSDSNSTTNSKDKNEKDRLLSDSIKCIDPEFTRKYCNRNIMSDGDNQVPMGSFDYNVYIASINNSKLIEYMKKNNLTYVYGWKQEADMKNGSTMAPENSHVLDIMMFDKEKGHAYDYYCWNPAYTYTKVPGNDKMTLEELEQYSDQR